MEATAEPQGWVHASLDMGDVRSPNRELNSHNILKLTKLSPQTVPKLLFEL